MTLSWAGTLRPLLFLLISSGIYLAGRQIVQMLPSQPSPQWLATGLTLDVVVGIPFLYWLLLVRGLGWKCHNLVLVFLVSVALASQLIPKEHAPLLGILSWIAIPLELFVVGFVLVKATRTIRRARQGMTTGTDTWHALRNTSRQILGASRFADMAAFEIAVLYFAFFARRARLDERTFSVDREAGYGGILALLMLAVGVEVVVVHLILVSLGGSIVAWVFTVLGIYGGILLVADYRAIRNRPIVLAEDAVTLRVGLRWEVDVPYGLIDQICSARGSEKDDKRLNLVVFGSPKLLLELKGPVEVEGLYGMRRSVTSLGLLVDDQQAFVGALQAKLDLQT